MAERSVAELVKRLRVERRQSLRTAAKDLGVDASYLSRVESGMRMPSEELQARISDHYGVERELFDLAAGRVPLDVLEILRAHPELLVELRDRYGA